MKQKGFTLIELLVVVAIIGILAAVGTVAYTGYTANAKKSAAKSNHASAVKYIAAELQKCNMDEDESMDGELTCDDRTKATEVQKAAAKALAEFKNPTAVIIKHAIPCGVAETNNIYNSWMKAYQVDELSAFGGVVVLNGNVDKKLAVKLSSIFLEVNNILDNQYIDLTLHTRFLI